MPAQPHNREIYVHSGPKAGTSCSRCSLLSFGNFDYLSTDSDFRLHCDLHPPALLFASFWKKHHLALTFYMLQQDLHLGFTNMDYPVTPLSTCDSCFQLNCCSALPTSTSISNIPPAPGGLDLVPLLIQTMGLMVLQAGYLQIHLLVQCTNWVSWSPMCHPLWFTQNLLTQKQSKIFSLRHNLTSTLVYFFQMKLTPRLYHFQVRYSNPKFAAHLHSGDTSKSYRW